MTNRKPTPFIQAFLGSRGQSFARSLALLTTSACLVGNAFGQTSALLEDIGASAPTPGPEDISQLTTGSGNPDGLNYYFDNASPPGQTFTTGSNPNGYLLTSLAVQTAGNSGQLPAAGQAYMLRLYTVSGTNATLLASYISQNDFVFIDYDWLQFTNLSLALPANSQFAYSFGRLSSGAGWENLGNVGGNLYAGGEVALIPPTGGGMTLGSSHNFDATFSAGLMVPNSIIVNSPVFSPRSAVTRGTTVTLTATAAGPGPLGYQWQTDGGAGAALTNVPGATGTSLVVDTTGFNTGLYQYEVVVTNASGSVTSAAVTLSVTYEAAATLVDAGDSIVSGANDISQFTGGGNGDGLNYYDDNGASHGGLWTGQTFTTGTNAQGYYLTSVAIQTGGGGSSATSTLMPYELFIFSVSANQATLLAHFTNASFNFTFGDWLQWSGFSLVLKSNSTYGYAFGRSASGTGWAALANSPNTTDLYPGGQLCFIPGAGGTITYGQTGNSDAVFDIGLLPIGTGPSPLPFANPITFNPGKSVVVGTSVTLSEAATGAAPLHYIWRTDGGAGILTNIPGSDRTNLVVDTTGWAPGAYQYAVVVTNAFGVSTSAVATLSVLYANTTATLTDIGATIPTPGSGDISQLNPGSGNPDGLNYYFDNASPPGQTFTTGNSPNGYVLSSLAIKLAGNPGGLPSTGQQYLLRIYKMSSGAVPYAVFTSQTNFVLNATDWLQWSGFSVPLAPNSSYAYTLGRASTGSGWVNLSSVTGDLYAGGEVVLIPTLGGAATTGSSHSFDGTFVIGLAQPGYPVVGPPLCSPTNSVYAGTPVILRASVSGTGPFTYQWMTDGGNAGAALTNIPGATAATLSVDTTPLGALNVTYALAVANGTGTTVGEAGLLSVAPASAPLLIVDNLPAGINRLAGASAIFRAAFDGTLPIFYQWQLDKGTGPTNLIGQTNTVLVLTNLTASQSGLYSLLATNSQGAISSSAANLTVYPLPAAPFTVKYQWLSTEGGNNAGNYSGQGIPAYGPGTTWNQVTGPSAWSPGTYGTQVGLLDNGNLDTGYSWTLTTGGSWDWSSSSTIPLLESAASAYATQPFVFSNLVSGIYNLVLFSCNGTESAQQTASALFTVQGQTRVATPTQDTSFVMSNNYVVFERVVVTDGILAGTWGPANGKNYGSLNGAQLQYVSPAVTLAAKTLPNNQLQLTWPNGVLLEAPAITGPWTTNSAPSPVTVPTTAGQKFYRVIVQ